MGMNCKEDNSLKYKKLAMVLLISCSWREKKTLILDDWHNTRKIFAEVAGDAELVPRILGNLPCAVILARDCANLQWLPRRTGCIIIITVLWLLLSIACNGHVCIYVILSAFKKISSFLFWIFVRLHLKYRLVHNMWSIHNLLKKNKVHCVML